MTAIIYAAGFLIFFDLLVFLLLWLVLMADSIARGHDLTTGKKTTENIVKIISARKTAKNFYDLGCARGAFAIRVKNRFPAISVHGVDDDPIRIFFAKTRALFFQCDIDFSSKNIFAVDLGNADIVYTYLWYDIMPTLEKKLQKELKPGAIVITNTSKFPTWKPIKKIAAYPKVSKPPDFETLFVYQKM